MRKIAAMTYAGNAVSMTLPAGAAISSRCTLRRLRTGASAPSAWWEWLGARQLQRGQRPGRW
jgi:hypothetical protein